MPHFLLRFPKRLISASLRQTFPRSSDPLHHQSRGLSSRPFLSLEDKHLRNSTYPLDRNLATSADQAPTDTDAAELSLPDLQTGLCDCLMSSFPIKLSIRNHNSNLSKQHSPLCTLQAKWPLWVGNRTESTERKEWEPKAANTNQQGRDRLPTWRLPTCSEHHHIIPAATTELAYNFPRTEKPPTTYRVMGRYNDNITQDQTAAAAAAASSLLWRQLSRVIYMQGTDCRRKKLNIWVSLRERKVGPAVWAYVPVCCR